MKARVSLEERSDRLVARYRDRLLFEYVFRPALARELAPRPYFHPVRSLAGVELTDHQPADHRWHLGLAYSWPVVEGWNFWGGPTFVRDRGYVELDNHGEIRHLGWRGHEEQLEWLDGRGTPIAAERRTIREPAVEEAAGAWSLQLWMQLENTGLRPLRIGSPTTEGRPMAGYAGLAWRGPASLCGAQLVLDDGLAVGDEGMGRRSRWLGCAADGVTVAFFEHAANPGVPNRWFVRSHEYLLIASSPVFDRELVLAPGAELCLRHRLFFADGLADAERLQMEAAR